MKTITMSEYKERISVLAERIARKFPGVKVRLCDDSIHLRTPHCSGSLDLRVEDVHGEFRMRPCVSFGSGTALVGSLDDVAAGLSDYGDVYDALLQLAATEEIVVVADKKDSTP